MLTRREKLVAAVFAACYAGSAPAQESPAPSNVYQTMIVRDFVLDGAALADRGTQVEITGAYIHQGNVAMLYADTRAVILAQSNSGTQHRIPLLTENASRRLRETFLSCDSNPATGQVGCLVVIRGRATRCDLSNAFGATHEEPCIDLEDGGPWSPPPPPVEVAPPLPAPTVTPEQTATERAQQAKQAELQAREHDVAVKECKHRALKAFLMAPYLIPIARKHCEQHPTE